MSKSKYTEVCEQIEAKIKSSARPGSKPACVTSASDLTMMAHALLNSPEHEVTTYAKKVTDEQGAPVPVTHQPAKRYREALKPALKQMGIDKAEVDQIDNVTLSKEHAAAMMDVAGVVIKDYIGAGRRYYFPITSTDESQMSLCVTDVPEKVSKPNRFVQDADGKVVPQPTGKTVTTKAHKALKARNGVPFWLKDIRDTED